MLCVVCCVLCCVVLCCVVFLLVCSCVPDCHRCVAGCVAAVWCTKTCDNLINALKLLANQRTDEDRPIQSFTKVDNPCALDVGHFNEGVRSYEVRRPKFEEEGPEASIREGLEELTLRAEEVGSPKSCIKVGHIAEDRWGPPLVDTDWYTFCQAIYKGIEGSEWG